MSKEELGIEGWKNIHLVTDPALFTAPSNSWFVLLKEDRVHDEESLRAALASALELSTAMESGWDLLLHQLQDLKVPRHETSVILAHAFSWHVLSASALRHYLMALWKLSHPHHGMHSFHWEFVFPSSWRLVLSSALDHLG